MLVLSNMTHSLSQKKDQGFLFVIKQLFYSQNPELCYLFSILRFINASSFWPFVGAAWPLSSPPPVPIFLHFLWPDYVRILAHICIPVLVWSELQGETKILKLKNLRPQDYANYSCIASVRNVCGIPDRSVIFRLTNKTGTVLILMHVPWRCRTKKRCSCNRRPSIADPSKTPLSLPEQLPRPSSCW